MDLQYQLKAGSYYLYDLRDKPSAVTGERRFRLKTDLVAIAFDLFTGEVHQHGNPTRIQSWAAHHRRLRCWCPGPSQRLVVLAPFDKLSDPKYDIEYNVASSFTVGRSYGGPHFLGNSRYGWIRASSFLPQARATLAARAMSLISVRMMMIFFSGS